MAKNSLKIIAAVLFLLFVWIPTLSADMAESPDFIYCDTESAQPGAQPLPPQIKNQFRFGGAYFDQDLNQNVGIPGDRYFQDEPMSYVDGYSGPTAWNEYKFYAAPLDIDARLAMSAHSTLGQSGATGFGQAAKWFILTGTSEPISIRADVAFQGKMFGSYDDPGMDARAFFTHGATILRYPTSGTTDRFAIVNGACVPSWDVCGPFGLAGTIPDFCFTCDGIEHPFNKIIRGNPESILPDIPFSILVFLNATASVSVPDGVFGEVNAYSNWHDPCLATSEKFYDWRLTPEGIIVDRDGEFATHDEIRIGDAGYKLHTMADTSTRFQLAETARTIETFNDDLMIKTASLDGTVAGAISGTLDIPELQLVLIDSGDYSGKGFFKGNFSTILQSVVYTGDWKGMAYFNETDQKIYLKGRLTGKLGGTTDGYLEESIAGSGVYDRLYCTISLGEVLNQPTSAILDLSGELNYLGQTPYPGCDLEMVQSVSSGDLSGETSGTLHLTVTQMRITEPGNPFQGEGYSFLSYSSPAGSGEGWTYDTVPFTNVHYMRGQLSGAFNGAISLVLDDDRDAHYLAGTIRGVDLGMPPASDLRVSGWSEWWVSPGDMTYFTVEYGNAGINTAGNVVVIIRIAPGMEYVSCSAGGIYDPNSNEVFFNVGSLSPKAYYGGYKYVCLRAVWGLSDRFFFTNEAYIYTDSPEKNVALDAQHTVMTDEWNQFQYARGNDYDVRLTPPDYDPNAPGWNGYTPTSFRDRTLKSIEMIKQYNSGWGEYIQQLYREGKIHHDPDLNSSAWSNWIGSRHLYIGYDDMRTNFKDTAWANNEYSQSWRAILASKILHEAQHAKQYMAASENGEIGAFVTENTMLLHYLNDLVQTGKYEEARTLADYMKTYRWQDLKERDSNWKNAIDISDDMIERMDTLLQQLDPDSLDPDGARLTIQGAIAYLKQKADSLPRDKIHNQSEFNSVAGTACDPNAIYGPEGCVLPGQRLDYRIEFENIGKGKAFGVYFTDTLPEGLDDATLDIGPVFSVQTGLQIAPAGVYDPATRTITWTVGEVGPSQGGEAEFHVNVRGDAPEGTEIIEYATVYFPSVPQMLNTEAAVALVCLTPPPQEAPSARPGGPYVGSTGINIAFDAGGSYDLDGGIAKYEWDWDGNGVYDQSTTNPVVYHKWVEPISGMVGLKVTDNEGQTSEATADLLVQSNAVTVYVDINSKVCPNSLKLTDKGALTVTILGTDGLDVSSIDPSTIELSRDLFDGEVKPVHWAYSDIETPSTDVPCGCFRLAKDGRKDLLLKFEAQQVIKSLDLNAVSGTTVEMMVTGALKQSEGGNSIAGKDCVKIKKK